MSAHLPIGMNLTERTIMDLWDAGLSKQQICAETRYSQEVVKSVISRLNTDGYEKDCRSIAIGSRDLLRAITRAHPERIAA